MSKTRRNFIKSAGELVRLSVPEKRQKQQKPRNNALADHVAPPLCSCYRNIATLLLQPCPAG